MRASRFGVYGYGGASTSELVKFWYQALGFCSLSTLLYYAQNKRKGFVLTANQVQKHYEQDTSAELKGRMQQRPLDQLRSRAGPRESQGGKGDEVCTNVGYDGGG